MALEGNLTDFGLSEILQLIAVQQKSGMLSVSSQEGSMVLFFRNGKAVSARDRRRKGKDPLKDYLLRYGVLSRNDLLHIMNISTQSKLDLTEIIVSENFLTEEEMKKHYKNQMQEAIHQILTWKQCTYKFIPGNDIVSGLKTWGEYSIEGLLMESMRRIDEFPQLLGQFPDRKMLISRARDLENEELDKNERNIWDLLEEERSLYYLIAHAKMPSFDTYEALKHLKEKNLIKTFSNAPSEEKTDAVSKGQDKRTREWIIKFLPVSITITLFLASGVFGIGRASRGLTKQLLSGKTSIKSSSIERNRTEERVRWLLELYRATNGRYPGSLQALENSGLCDDSFMMRVKEFSFRYHLTPQENTYTLF